MLYLQDFSFSKSYSMHEALVRSCSSSSSGYGAYAFASKSGVDLLFKDQEFDALLERGTYSIVVGVDEITNIKCLDSLKKLVDVKPNLNVSAFCHNDGGSLFHPKVSFFKNEDNKGSLIIGSGNLTLGGLRKNREAFGVIDLSEEEYNRMESYWLEWLDESKEYIKGIDDAEVISKAEGNVFRRKPRVILPKKYEIEPDLNDNEILETITEGWGYSDTSQILFAEIPKSGNRWKQANFDIGTFTTFFGATPGDNSQRILMRSLNIDSTLSETEIRQSVSVKSQNYRFELDAASGLLYPEQGKPIGVFIRLTTRMFLYHLFMPTHELHGEISEWMNGNWSGRADRMKRIVVNVGDVTEILEKSVFQQYKS